MSDSPLRVPELTIPAHPWRPGRSPRPTEPALIADSRTVVLHGADLFDAGAWWEAHAIWESEWRAHSPGTATREALQGLIQAAAYHLKTAPELTAAALRLRTRAMEHLERSISLGGTSLHGLDLARMRDDLAVHQPGSTPLRLHSVHTGDRGPSEVP